MKILNMESERGRNLDQSNEKVVSILIEFLQEETNEFTIKAFISLEKDGQTTTIDRRIDRRELETSLKGFLDYWQSAVTSSGNEIVLRIPEGV